LHFLSIILDKDCYPYFPSPFQLFKNQNAPLPSVFDEWNRQRTRPLTIKKTIGNKPLFLLSIFIEYNSIILQKQHNVKIQPISPYVKT